MPIARRQYHGLRTTGSGAGLKELTEHHGSRTFEKGAPEPVHQDHDSRRCTEARSRTVPFVCLIDRKERALLPAAIPARLMPDCR